MVLIYGGTYRWEQRKLGEVTQITMGQSPNSENYTDNPEDYILVQGNADMKDGRVTPRVWTTQITKLAEKNDLILSVRAPVGDIGKTDYNVVLGRGVAAIKGNEFIFQLLGKMKQDKYWTKLSTGSTFESISSKDIQEAVLMLPNRAEKIKIGEFLKKLDDAVALHQRRNETLKKLIKGLLNKVFPLEQERLPLFRFAHFQEEWEQHKLKEILTVNSGRDYKHLDPGNIPVFGTGGYMLSVNGTLSERDAIGIGRKGTIDKPQYLKAPFWTVDTLFFLTTKLNFDLLFLYYMTQKINWKKMDESTGVPSLSKSVIEKIRQNFPYYDEQVKIGILFKTLDDSITLHQSKLEGLKKIKKSLLQKMFI